MTRSESLRPHIQAADTPNGEAPPPGDLATQCCGYCDSLEDCYCDMCACGHHLHDHDKWNWHRLCARCTPRAAAAEAPNEMTLPNGYQDYGPELDRHVPAGDPPMTCCAENSARLRALPPVSPISPG